MMIKTLRMSAAVTLLAVAAAMPAHAKDKGTSLSLNSAACGATTKTDTQAGYVSCLGSFTGNIDNQLSLIYSTMAKCSAAGGLGFTANSYFSTADYKDSGNPFAQNEGARDDGVINFDQAMTGSFVLGLKQGNGFSLYLFNGAAVAGGISSIAYDTNGVKAGSGAELSHAGYFGSAVAAAVPEPESYAMLLAGLGMIGFMRRRQAR